MTKIQAASRLVIAKADEAEARRYIEHLTGVEPGKMWDDEGHIISFRVTKEQRRVAEHELKKKMAEKILTPVPRHTADSSSSDSYYVDDSKTRIITVSYQSDYNHGIYGLISLTDKNHYETFMQRLKRLRAEGKR
jgi:hypothetical protein